MGVEDSRLVPGSGLAVSLAGIGFVALGAWARREVRATLARERIVHPSDARPVTTGAAARSLAELIRRSTLESAGDRTYSETALYLDAERTPTSDRALAMVDERSGEPVENPEHALWLQSTTLQTALMQAYMASRIGDLMLGLGAVLLAAGAGLSASRRGRQEGEPIRALALSRRLRAGS